MHVNKTIRNARESECLCDCGTRTDASSGEISPTAAFAAFGRISVELAAATLRRRSLRE